MFLTSGISALSDLDVAVLTAARNVEAGAMNELFARAILPALAMTAVARGAAAAAAGACTYGGLP